MTSVAAPPRAAAGELDAAGITDPALRDAYTHCRALNARARPDLLPRHPPAGPGAAAGHPRALRLRADGRRRRRRPGRRRRARTRSRRASRRSAPGCAVALAGTRTRRAGADGEPVVAALADTVARYGIEHRHLEDFMDSMAHGPHGHRLPDLRRPRASYVHGSAAVIGLQVLPVLGTVGPAGRGRARTRPPRRRLPAHQLPARRRRGPRPGPRLPARRRARGVRRRPRPAGVVPDAPAAPTPGAPGPGPPGGPHPGGLPRAPSRGIALLDPVSRPCVRTAFVLYGGILDEIVAVDYDVLRPAGGRRERPPRRRRRARSGPRRRGPAAVGTVVSAAEGRHGAPGRARPRLRHRLRPVPGGRRARTTGGSAVSRSCRCVDYRVDAWCHEAWATTRRTRRRCSRSRSRRTGATRCGPGPARRSSAASSRRSAYGAPPRWCRC